MRARAVSVLLALAVGAAGGLAPLPRGAGAAGLGGDGTLHPVTPARLLDTHSSDRVGPGGTVKVDVTGLGGVPADDVLAVALDVTASEATAATSVTAYATGVTRPLTAAVHVAPGEAATGAVVVPVGDDGTVTLYNAAGHVHLTADVTGWYGTAGATDGLRFHAFAPQPAVDTRTANEPLGPDETRPLEIPDRLHPRTLGAAILLRVTVPSPLVATRLTVYGGNTRPAVTTLAAPAGRVSSTVVAVTRQPGSPYGIAVHNATGTAHVVVHVVGWADDAVAGDDGRYRPLPVSARLADTRNGTGGVPAAPAGGGGTLSLTVAGREGVPYGATAALLTVSALEPSAKGALTVHPAGDADPGTQQVGYAASRPGASLVLAKLGPDGRIAVRASAGPVHVVVDVHGWYTGAADYVPLPSAPVAGGLVVDRASRYAYATNPGKNRVEVVDLSSGTLLAPIAVGTQPAGLDLTPDERTLYVTNTGGHDISVVDLESRAEVRRIPLVARYRPTDIAIGAHGTALVYVEHEFDAGSLLWLRLSDDFVHARKWSPHVHGAGSLAASGDREFIAVGYAGSTPGTLWSYDARADRFTDPGYFLSHGVSRAAASSDGTLMAGMPYLVDRVREEAVQLPTPAGVSYRCTAAVFSPDDTVVYQVCPDGRLVLTATADSAQVGAVVHAGRMDHDEDRAAGHAVATRDGSRVVVVTHGGLALAPVGAPYA